MSRRNFVEVRMYLDACTSPLIKLVAQQFIYVKLLVNAPAHLECIWLERLSDRIIFPRQPQSYLTKSVVPHHQTSAHAPVENIKFRSLRLITLILRFSVVAHKQSSHDKRPFGPCHSSSNSAELRKISGRIQCKGC